ncbi:aldose 1-epimerase family protein [Goodfellowiella coeruleoviolacea]|uniref:Aldose 1-epimerase n=1 Tax=Goodfellowiella coeruleoviolacea TaxID=334858 RepID=A0AAE3KDL7_9PSEU|nr:aldose 1-epimerase family protein [Goodfellowiella coeruleoviolacea]MCP2164196.1 aldose 1-epimerase [Goodfellowiella coeruleoviolacea]
METPQPNRLPRRAALAAGLAATTVGVVAGQAGAEPGAPDQQDADQSGTARTLATGRQFELASGQQRAVVTEVGGRLRSWRVRGREVLLTHGADELGDSYLGHVLLPWPNRIDHGRYTFNGVEQQTPLTEPGRDCALHGLVSWVPWVPVAQRRDRVRLAYVLHPQYGYPFTLSFQIEYALTGDGLRVTLTARNVGTAAAPFGAGYHPYVQVGSRTIDSALLTIPADTYYTVNDRLIPTGKASVAGTPLDFRTPRLLGDTKLDTAYTGLSHVDGEAVAALELPGGPRVEVWMDETHRYVQAYTDDGQNGRPNRAGITLEPMTCAPNSFNTGDGLIVLEPGQRYQGSWGLRATG